MFGRPMVYILAYCVRVATWRKSQFLFYFFSKHIYEKFMKRYQTTVYLYYREKIEKDTSIEFSAK